MLLQSRTPRRVTAGNLAYDNRAVYRVRCTLLLYSLREFGGTKSNINQAYQTVREVLKPLFSGSFGNLIQ